MCRAGCRFISVRPCPLVRLYCSYDKWTPKPTATKTDEKADAVRSEKPVRRRARERISLHGLVIFRSVIHSRGSAEPEFVVRSQPCTVLRLHRARAFSAACSGGAAVSAGSSRHHRARRRTAPPLVSMHQPHRRQPADKRSTRNQLLLHVSDNSHSPRNTISQSGRRAGAPERRCRAARGARPGKQQGRPGVLAC